MPKILRYIMVIMASLVPQISLADVNIAVVAPKAGEYKNFGEELIKGVEIAAAEINKQGGLKGEKINVITVDDQCDARLAVSTAQMMAVSSSRRDKISLVIGPYCTAAFDEVADIYAKAQIFQIIPTTVSRRQIEYKHKGLVKMVGDKERQAQDFFNYWQKTFPNQNVALVYNGDMRNVVDVAAALQQEFLAHDRAYNLKSFNFTNYADIDRLADEILQSGIKIAYILGEPQQVADLAKDLKKEHKYFAVFSNLYQAGEIYTQTLGNLADGSYFLALPSLKDNPAFTETLVKLRLLGFEPRGLNVYGYAAVQLWKELVDKANSFDYAKLAQALEEDTLSAAWGEVTYAEGNPQESLPYGIYRFEGGEYTQVY